MKKATKTKLERYLEHVNGPAGLQSMIYEGSAVEFIEWFKNQCNRIAQEHGWNDKPVEKGVDIALMHSELSEALEGIRKDLQSDHIPGFSMEEEEMADVLVRIFHYSAKHKLRLGMALLAKMTFNETRPYRHGGKRF